MFIVLSLTSSNSFALCWICFGDNACYMIDSNCDDVHCKCTCGDLSTFLPNTQLFI